MKQLTFTGQPSSLFVAGLWFDPTVESALTAQLPPTSRMARLSLVGIPSLERRVKVLKEALCQLGAQCKTIIAHSAGCVVVVEALQELRRMGITTVVLLNPAPLKGVPFWPWDKLWWVTITKMPRLLAGKDISLNPGEKAKLFPGISAGITNSFVPESGEFLRQMVFRQFGLKKKVIIPDSLRVLTFQAGKADCMLGSTQRTTVDLIGGEQLESLDDSSHLGTLVNFPKTLEVLRKYRVSV